MKLFASASPAPPTRERLEKRVARYAQVDDEIAVAVVAEQVERLRQRHEARVGIEGPRVVVHPLVAQLGDVVVDTGLLPGAGAGGARDVEQGVIRLEQLEAELRRAAG